MTALSSKKASAFDLLLEGKLLIELKVVEKLLPIHQAQIITYLKLTKRQLGFLINFNVPLIKDGIKRIICPASAALPSATSAVGDEFTL